eukprot:2917288-Pleurochrysis_carterae.AAC.2
MHREKERPAASEQRERADIRRAYSIRRAIGSQLFCAAGSGIPRCPTATSATCGKSCLQAWQLATTAARLSPGRCERMRASNASGMSRS